MASVILAYLHSEDIFSLTIIGLKVSRKPNLFQNGMFNFIVISIHAAVIQELCDVYLCISSPK